MVSPLEAWYEALAAKVGVVIQTDNPQLFMQRMYRARVEANDPDLQTLSIVVSPTVENHLWVIKNGKAKEQTPTGESDP